MIEILINIILVVAAVMSAVAAVSLLVVPGIIRRNKARANQAVIDKAIQRYIREEKL